MTNPAAAPAAPSTLTAVRRALLGVGLTLLAAGLLVGLVLPVKSGGADCGTAFTRTPASSAQGAADAAAAGVDYGGVLAIQRACGDARGLPRAVALVLLVAGAGVTVTGFAIRA